MPALSASERRALTLSAGLHAGVLIVAVLVVLASWLRAEEEEELVFELVTPNLAPESAPAPNPSPALPELEPLEPLEVPPMEDLRPVPEVPPAPLPVVESPPEAPPPRPMSIEEFRRNNPIPDRPAPRPAPPRRIDRPTLETDVRQRRQQTMSQVQVTQAPTQSAATDAAWQGYLQQVRSRLFAAFQPVGRGLAATAEFSLDGQGRFIAVRLTASSGDPAFDQAVRAAFAAALPVGPPPSADLAGRQFSIQFRSVD